MEILVTGSGGLIGSQAVRYYCDRDHQVVGVDNNSRKYFFGESASTLWNRQLLEQKYPKNYSHRPIDIRDQANISQLFELSQFDLIIHTAAQPSHDWAAKEPMTDFTINALGTLILLEAYRKYRPEAVFIFTSTNKVYGDTPNNPDEVPLQEHDTRYEVIPGHHYFNGINEKMSLDQSTHSLFGVSKASADLMVQEYGRYFGLNTGTFRGGCLTGPAHSSAQLHGFLAYLVHAIAHDEVYKIFGYKGKQVRDNIHAFDVITAFDEFYKNPRPGEVYNIGGSRYSNTSILEAIPKIEELLGKTAQTIYDPQNRTGDHIWYISDVSKLQSHYPNWRHTYDGDQILEDLCRSAVNLNH